MHKGTPFQILTLQSLLLVLNSTKPAEIPARVKALSSDYQDTLMKYLYKAMAMPGYADVNSSALLSWHEKASVSNDRPPPHRTLFSDLLPS